MTQDPIFNSVTARRMTETGDAPGLDPVFEQVWAWAVDRRIVGAHSNPDDVVSVEQLMAFLHRFAASLPPGNPEPGDVLRPGDLVRLDRAT